MDYDSWKLSAPEEKDEPETETELKCSCCLETVNEVFVLGIETYGLKSNDSVCSYCCNELHNNLTLTN